MNGLDSPLVVTEAHSGKNTIRPFKPGRPAAADVLKSIEGTRLSTAETMIWFRSASA